MSKTSLPAFTAEASLYGTSGRYRTAAFREAGEAILPQIIKPIHYCSPCVCSSNGCWKSCTFCPGGVLPDGCTSSSMRCKE